MEVGGELGQAKVLVQWWLDTNWWSSVEEWTGKDVCQALWLGRLLGIYGMSKPTSRSKLEVSKFYDR